MGLMDRIKKATGTEDNYNGYDEDYYNEFDDGQNPEEPQQQPIQDPMGGVQGMGQMNSGLSLSGNGTSVEMKVVKPQNFDSVSQIADHLLNKRTVVLNLENTNKETARRLIDFLSGVAYSINGSLKKIATNAYVIAPSSVDVGDAQLRDKRRAEKAERAEREAEPEDNDGDLGDFGFSRNAIR